MSPKEAKLLSALQRILRLAEQIDLHPTTRMEEIRRVARWAVND